jgi:hypothetical protein
MLNYLKPSNLFCDEYACYCYPNVEYLFCFILHSNQFVSSNKTDRSTVLKTYLIQKFQSACCTDEIIFQSIVGMYSSAVSLLPQLTVAPFRLSCVRKWTNEVPSNFRNRAVLSSAKLTIINDISSITWAFFNYRVAYFVRRRSHNLQIPVKVTYLNDCNFITRTLHANLVFQIPDSVALCQYSK